MVNVYLERRAYAKAHNVTPLPCFRDLIILVEQTPSSVSVGASRISSITSGADKKETSVDLSIPDGNGLFNGFSEHIHKYVITKNQLHSKRLEELEKFENSYSTIFTKAPPQSADAFLEDESSLNIMPLGQEKTSPSMALLAMSKLKLLTRENITAIRNHYDPKALGAAIEALIEADITSNELVAQLSFDYLIANQDEPIINLTRRLIAPALPSINTLTALAPELK